MDFSALLKDFLFLSALTVGVTQVYKEVFNDADTQKASICVAMALAFVTGTSLLTPLGFKPSMVFSNYIPQLQVVFFILYYFVDLVITGFIASKGSNYLVDLLKGQLSFQKMKF